MYFSFVHLGITLNLVLGFYSGLSCRVRTVYLPSLSVVLLLSSSFNASALVWFYNSLEYLNLTCTPYIALSEKSQIFRSIKNI
jgi:hypothetical protein